MGSRFFLIPFFPPLSFDASPEMSLLEAEFFARLNLSCNDIAAIDTLSSLIDVENVKAFFAGLPITSQGRIPHDTLRERLENEECPLPELEPFFAMYTTAESRSAHAHFLMRCFFDNLPAGLPHFVQQYFSLTNSSRHVLAFLRANEKAQSYSVEEEALGFDLRDTSQWPVPLLSLIEIWQSYRHSPHDLERAISRWKFDLIGALAADSGPFSLDHVLAYLLRLRLVEERRELTNPIHLNTLERVVRAIQ